MQNFGGIGISRVIPGILFKLIFYIPYRRIKEGELIPHILQSFTFPYASNIPGRICPNCGCKIPNDSYLWPYCGKDFRYNFLIF